MDVRCRICHNNPTQKFPWGSVCTTIIDKDIVWYGAINALGYATEEDNVIKVVDNKLANELLEVLLTSKILCEIWSWKIYAENK